MIHSFEEFAALTRDYATEVSPGPLEDQAVLALGPRSRVVVEIDPFMQIVERRLLITLEFEDILDILDAAIAECAADFF